MLELMLFRKEFLAGIAAGDITLANSATSSARRRCASSST